MILCNTFYIKGINPKECIVTKTKQIITRSRLSCFKCTLKFEFEFEGDFEFILTIDKINMGILRRILRCMRLYHRKNNLDKIDFASFLIDQLEGH